MTFQCTLNTRLKKIVVVAAKSKQYFPLQIFVFIYLYKTPTMVLQRHRHSRDCSLLGVGSNQTPLDTGILMLQLKINWF